MLSLLVPNLEGIQLEPQDNIFCVGLLIMFAPTAFICSCPGGEKKRTLRVGGIHTQQRETFMEEWSHGVKYSSKKKKKKEKTKASPVLQRDKEFCSPTFLMETDTRTLSWGTNTENSRASVFFFHYALLYLTALHSPMAYHPKTDQAWNITSPIKPTSLLSLTESLWPVC